MRILSSRTDVTVVDFYDGQSAPRPADGTAYLRTQSLTAFLGLGRRFEVSKTSIDVLAGPEAAYIFDTHVIRTKKAAVPLMVPRPGLLTTTGVRSCWLIYACGPTPRSGCSS